MNLKSGSTQRSPFNIPATSNWSGNTTTRSIRFNGTSRDEANGCLPADQACRPADLITSLAWVRHFWSAELLCNAIWALGYHGFNEQIFGADEQVYGCGPSD